MSIERKKTEARALIRFLAEKGIKLSQTHALEAVAAMAGAKNWSTEKARVEAQGQARQDFLRDVANTPLAGEFCDGEVQHWVDQDHVYGRLERVVTEARALLGLGATERPALYGTAEGWSGSQDFPCYRQGRLVVSVSNLPDMSKTHLWVDFSECTAQGEPTDDNVSLLGVGLAKSSSAQERQRFVRLAAQLFGPFVTENASVRSLSYFLTQYTEKWALAGPDVEALAQGLDRCESTSAVLASVEQALLTRLGADKAQEYLDELVDDVCREAGLDDLNGIADEDDQDAFLDELESAISNINNEGISGQLHYLSEQVGKAHLRTFIGERIGIALIPETALAPF